MNMLSIWATALLDMRAFRAVKKFPIFMGGGISKEETVAFYI
jgi:hypothetical protein